MVIIKRRVVQHGPSTLIISLPSTWVKEHNIKKGNELNVEVEDGALIISTDNILKSNVGLEIEVNVKEQKKVLHRLISALYKIGYNQITINYGSNSEFQISQDTINNELIGFEIIKEKKDSLIAKQISTVDAQEFENMFRRTFLFLLSVSEDSFEALQKKDKAILQNIVLRDRNINKLTDYCRRAINKDGTKLFKGRSSPLYYILEEVEKIGDGYKNICNYCIKNRMLPSKKNLKIHGMLNKLLRQFYELLYKFNLDGLSEFLDYKQKIEAEVDSLIATCSKKELKLLMIEYNILNLIFDMNGALMATVL